MLRATAVALAAAHVAAVRLDDGVLDTVQEDPPAAPEAGPGNFPDFQMSKDRTISWDFMHLGRGFNYAPKIDGPWKWMKRVFFSGRRKFFGQYNEDTGAYTGLKDEIAAEHTCATKGRRDETYYASSLCYWIPDIKDPEMSDNFGLAWQTPDNIEEMCPGISRGKGGKCVKCSVCHNNARAEGRKLSYTNFPTEIPMDTESENGCMTETKIESNITTTFRDDPANADVVADNDDCLAAKAEVAQAEGLVAANEEAQNSKRAESQQLQNEKNTNNQRIPQLLNDINNLNNQIHIERGIAYEACFQCCLMTSWRDELKRNNIDNPTILMLMRNTMQQQQNDGFGDPFGHKRQCIVPMNRMGELLNDVQSKEQQRYSIDNTNAQIDARIAQLGKDVQDLVSAAEGLRTAVQESKQRLDVVDRRVRSGSCEDTEAEYKTQLTGEMTTRVPKFYDYSCEKACMDFVANEGCGVVEGNTIPQGGDDVTNTGQARLVCEPPSMSWVRTPFTYINVTEPMRAGIRNQQCQELFRVQQPIRAQAILKSGRLWKRERLWRRWRERFFVLEGGDEGRSGILRYWRDIAQDERYNQGIILWDARSTKVKPGSRYGVQGEAGQNMKGEAESWADLIGKEIKFPKQRND